MLLGIGTSCVSGFHGCGVTASSPPPCSLRAVTDRSSPSARLEMSSRCSSCVCSLTPAAARLMLCLASAAAIIAISYSAQQNKHFVRFANVYLLSGNSATGLRYYFR